MVAKKVCLVIVFLLMVTSRFVLGQIAPPYYNGFDMAQDTVGWTHYALTGSDDWEWGVPEGQYLNSVVSSPYGWGTNLDSTRSENSIMCLETPSFDFSSAVEYLLMFGHQYRTFGGGGNIDYSVNGGVTWQLLDGQPSEQFSWYSLSPVFFTGETGWVGSWIDNFRFSGHSLAFLIGESNVKFRFKFGGSAQPREGWVIDEFRIIPNNPNVIALDGMTYNASKHFPSFSIDVPLLYNAIVSGSFSNTTEYYFSYDNVFDGSDQLIGTKTDFISSTVSSWEKTFPMIPNISYGDYYIFFKHDTEDNLTEADETDNIAKCILHIDSTFVPDYREDFESGTDWWTPITSAINVDPWVKGNNEIHQIYGTHSGDNAYYIPKAPVSSQNAELSLESPYLDFSNTSGNVMCLWYKTFDKYSEMYNVGVYSDTDTAYLFTNYNYTEDYDSVFTTRLNDWDCACSELEFLDGNINTKVQIRFGSFGNYTNTSRQMVVDDIYIGSPRPDLSIEHAHLRTLNANWAQDTLYYNLFNSGLATATASETEFYWSLDSVLDPSDFLLGSKLEPILSDTSFSKEFFSIDLPTNVEGDYYVIAKVDVNAQLDEMWETNNTSVFPVRVTPALNTPYANDFEVEIDHWYHGKQFGSDNWEWAVPQGNDLNAAFSGQKGFITKADGFPDEMSVMFLYTPVFDLTNLTSPVIQFNMHLPYAAPNMNASYSVDNGASWIILDPESDSYTGWFNRVVLETNYGKENLGSTYNTDQFFNYRESTFANSQNFQGRDVKRNTHYNLDIAHLQHYNRIQFRFNFTTPNNVGSEGALIDDFRITEAETDLQVTYDKSLMISSVSNDVQFFMDISNTRNYMSMPSVSRFYLSQDTVLDAGDYYLGEDSIPMIRPHHSFYLNTLFSSPQPNLNGYNYLVYELDATNTTTEINEVNNVGNWPLELDGVSTYPYYESFNDTVVNGWHHYVTRSNGDHFTDGFRFRNMLAPAEAIYQMDLHSGTMFTERINNTTSNSLLPFWYLESPAFDFSGQDSIEISFQLMCVGTDFNTISEGGNIVYSINGGDSWNVLYDQNMTGTNWFNVEEVETLDDEPGWAFNVVGTGMQVLDSTALDISFLAGYQHVQFRFKYRSNTEFNPGYDVQGMRIDDFRINTVSSVVVNVDEEPSLVDVRVYPNPTSGEVTVDFGSIKDEFVYELFDITGKLLVQEQVTNASRCKVITPSVSGMYFLKITDTDGTMTKKIIRQ